MFTREHFQTLQDMSAELDKAVLDGIIVGQIMSSVTTTPIVGPSHKHAPVPRSRARVTFSHHGFPICKATFLQLHGIGKYYHTKSTMHACIH